MKISVIGAQHSGSRFKIQWFTINLDVKDGNKKYFK